jgi:hypothetical protein
MVASRVVCSPWATVADLPADVVPLLPAEEWDRWLLFASEILYAATARQWRNSGCSATVTLRGAAPWDGEGSYPYHRSWGQCGCLTGWEPAPGGWGLWPVWDIGWRGVHHQPLAVQLPHRDVTQVTAVLVDGQAFAAWRLTGAGWLERTDGHPWRVCGEATQVTYAFGRPPPVGGELACRQLAVELGKAAAGEPCSLPKRVQSITRQGVTVAMLDPMTFIDKGLTGLPTVDMWIRSINPKGRQQDAEVWSPDIPTGRRLP